MAKIFLSVPILDRPELKMIFSMYQAIQSCREHQVRLYFNENDSLISRVRNVHMSVFLNEYPDFDYFMSLDSDIESINCYPTNNIITKLVSHNLDFVGGLYALKQVGPPRCSSVAVDKTSDIKFNSGLKEMLWLSTGCWCIKRSAVEKMVKAYPELEYDGDDNMSGKKVHGLYIPFIADLEDNGIKFKKYLSEDWSFCRRWRDIGGKIYADTSIVLAHHGKIPYMLWNVEVVAKKRNVMPDAIPSLPPSVPTIPDAPNPFADSIAKIKGIPNPSGQDLPPVGFDLLKT